MPRLRRPAFASDTLAKHDNRLISPVVASFAAAAVGILVSTLHLPGSVAYAAPDPTHFGGGNATTDVDFRTWIDANNIEMVVSNRGSFGYDLFNGWPGLFYPTGGDATVLYAGGLWIGAHVDQELRVTIAEYSFEYRPGRIEADGSWDPDYDSNPRWRTYKIERGDTPGSNPDYAEWPTEDGAPVDENGAPLHLGKQTLFSVCHDADPSAHENDAGSTDPLGAEVQQTVFGLDNPGGASDLVFVQWKIVNKGDSEWRDAYVSSWLDPDLGGSGDDLVGCDPDQSLGYCYNATNADEQYGAMPPALGVQLVQGPIVPSPGDVAWVSGAEVPDYRNLPMTAFLKYINGTDPSSPTASYNFLQGLNADGTPIFDPETGDITTFMVSGDPVQGDGWLDSTPDDRRMMICAGPFDLPPGASQTVAIAIVMGQGTDRIDSIARMRENGVDAVRIFRAAWGDGAPGACCLDVGPCVIRTQADCVGTFLADESCLPGTCFDLPGACCFDSGACLLLTADDCPGDFHGVGSECDPDLCPFWGPEAACCIGNGACELRTERECVDLGGSYQRNQTCELRMPGNAPGWRLNYQDDPMFDEVRASGHEVYPDGLGGPGWNVWHRFDSYQRTWALSAGGGDGGLDRITRSGADEANLTPAYIEMRWDYAPDNYGWWTFDDDTAARIPFGLYRIDPQTGESERLIVVLFSAGGTVGVFDISPDTPDGYFADPSSDWTFAYEGDYDAFLLDAQDGRIDDPSHAGNELFARLVVTSPSLSLPDDDTVIWLVTNSTGIQAGSGFDAAIPAGWTSPGGAERCFDEPTTEVLRDGVVIAETHRPDYLDEDVIPGETYSYTFRSVNPFTGERSEESMPVVAQAGSGHALPSGAAPGVPVLDGEISYNEWLGARAVDASPLEGFETARMMFMNDEDNLYIAIVGPGSGFERIYLDGNANGIYDRERLEGELFWFFRGPKFTKAYGAYPNAKFEASQIATWAEFSQGGYYGISEIRISLSEGPLQGLGAGDTIGLYISALSNVSYPRGPRRVLREAPWHFARLTLADPQAAVDGGSGSEGGNGADDDANGATGGDEETASVDGLVPHGLVLDRTLGLPNPFGDNVTIAYRVPSSQSVSVRIYGTDGRRVATLLDGQLELAGLHGVSWDGKDDRGRTLPPGMYYYEVRGETFRWTERITRIR